MILKTTPYFVKILSKKIKRNPLLRNKIDKQINLLIKDYHHPSLKTHKLSGSRNDQHSIWIEGNIRITFKIVKNVIILVDLITHDEY
ncbi:hypothetical protein A2572_00840 [Candidatus Collierbacteria bacterium RIFOXYD1_FULL_40_9]|uniref:Uncharacterized protein n=1 Tax=Candidatus Collierbacteria bacterium RIFOXYD1_FULL_40_9 TaxID=1817731 RepID=A0A1F5FVW2_9BACT|nr:MAG: hypothetical protein A2572_00840 [Candidatus Collierbacteria bacterium RIFOXYD1_FULL_40_9]